MVLTPRIAEQVISTLVSDHPLCYQEGPNIAKQAYQMIGLQKWSRDSRREVKTENSVPDHYGNEWKMMLVKSL